MSWQCDIAQYIHVRLRASTVGLGANVSSVSVSGPARLVSDQVSEVPYIVSCTVVSSCITTTTSPPLYQSIRLSELCQYGQI